jgi:translocation and assembly module TamA
MLIESFIRWSLATTLLAGLVLFCVGADAAIRVEIDGLPAELETNARAYLTLVERERRVAADEERMSATTIKRLYARSAEEIKLSLQPFGYYQVVVNSQLEELPASVSDEPSDFTATFSVNLGSRTHFRLITIEVLGSAATLPEVEAALKMPGIVSDQPLLHGAYDNLKARLLQLVYRAGYLDAGFSTAELKVYPDMGVADATLIIDGGEPYFFGPITIEQDILAPEFVARYVKISPGEPFNSERLIDLQLSLADSAYFAGIGIDVRRADAIDYHIPVVLHPRPGKARRYTTSLGFGTDTGVRAGLGLQVRRLNRLGHQFKSNVQGSSRQIALGAEYRLPIYEVDTDHLAFFVNVENGEIADADSSELSIGARLENNWWIFRRQLYLRLRSETFQFGDEPSDRASLLTPGIELSYQVADDLTFTRKGFSASLDIHGGIESPLTETTFLQARFATLAVLPLASRARLLIRGEVGFTSTKHFDELPPSERFYTGGDRSVRGYAYESLGPKDDRGNEIGGRYLSNGSIEVDYLVRGDLGLAAFYDMGNTTSELQADFKAAIGVGLRYRTQIGLIRIDFAHPLDDDDTNFRLHLTVGPDL